MLAGVKKGFEFVSNHIFAPAAPEIRSALTLLQYERCSREVPLMNFVAIISTALIVAAAWGPEVSATAMIIPGLGIILGFYHMFLWHRRSACEQDLAAKQATLRNTTHWGVMFAAMASGWTSYMYLQPTTANPGVLPVILMLGVIASAVANSSMPRTATAIIAIGTMPSAMALMTRGDMISKVVGFAMLMAGFMQFRFICEQHRQNLRLLTLEQEALHLANTDALTGLLNRRAFAAAIETVAQSANSDSPFAVAMLDLDGFKNVNDQFGHHAGDKLLKSVADRLREHSKPGDIVGRLGGDEFALIMCNVESEVDVERRATAVMVGLCQAVTLGKRVVPVGGSLGYARWPMDGATLHDLLIHADRALYRVKRKRKVSRGEEVTAIPGARKVAA